MIRERAPPREAVGEGTQNQRKDPGWGGDWRRTMVSGLGGTRTKKRHAGKASL